MSVRASNPTPASANSSRCLRSVQHRNVTIPQPHVVQRIRPTRHERKRHADFLKNLGRIRHNPAIITTAMGARVTRSLRRAVADDAAQSVEISLRARSNTTAAKEPEITPHRSSRVRNLVQSERTVSICSSEALVRGLSTEGATYTRLQGVSSAGCGVSTLLVWRPGEKA